MPARRKRRPQPRRRAATADVLGTRTPVRRVPARWKSHFERLTALRNHLLHRQGDLVRNAGEEQPNFSQHMADAGTDSFDRDLALSQISSDQDALYEINEALNRIHNGTYGVCELTGKRIEARRLAAIPWTRFSLAAEKTLEKEGAIRPTRLAPSESVTRGDSNSGDEDDSE